MIPMNISLVNWGMGALIIGVFVLVCVIMVAVVMQMSSTKKEE